MSLSVITIKDEEEFFSPPSLQDICVRFCAQNAETLLLSSSPPQVPSFSPRKAEKRKLVKLRKSVCLPTEVWERVLENLLSLSEKGHLSLVQTVYQKIPHLRRVHLRNCLCLCDEDLELIMVNYPVSLDIHNCPSLTKKTVEIINKFGKDLESLVIGNSAQILPTNVDNWMANLAKKNGEEPAIRKLARSVGQFLKGKFIKASSEDTEESKQGSRKPPGLLTTPNLKKLVIWGHHVTQMQQVRRQILLLHDQQVNQPMEEENGGGGDAENGFRVTVDYWEYLTRDFVDKLEHLDLTSCQEMTDMGFLMRARSSLKGLYLHDVLLDYDLKTWGVLEHLGRLRFLDVSQYNELASVFATPDVILNKLVASLPELLGLDISGTNLAGFEPDPGATSSISGLASRTHKPLAFLGLLSTQYNACSRSNIPALQIAGGDTIQQLILALKIYLPRDNILRKAIRILHERLSRATDEFFPSYTILDLLLKIMKTHQDDKHTVIVSLAASFHVLKRILIGPPHKHEGISGWRVDLVFTSVVRAMEVHSQDISLMRNGVLIFLLLSSQLQMNAVNAGMLVPATLTAGLTYATSALTADPFLLKGISYLLHLATHFEEKEVMTKLLEVDAPEKMVGFLMELLNKRILDQMATFWIILLKLINFPPTSSNREVEPTHYSIYAQPGFVELCFKLIKTCNENHLEPEGNGVGNDQVGALREVQKPALAFLTNMLHNAPASESLLVNSANVKLVTRILDTGGLGDHELLHVSCGFLAHVASSRESYNLVNPSRQDILNGMFRVMFKMNLGIKFRFTFRNLSQLYKLLKVDDAPEVHVWVLWTLVKLTEDNQAFLDMIIRDGKLNLSTLNLHYSSSKIGARVYRKREELHERLADSLDKYYASRQDGLIKWHS